MRLLAVLAICLLPATTLADNPERRAKALYKQGLDHYEQKRYREAVDAFKKAYALTERAALLFNIAQAFRLARDCQPALDYYREYLAAEPRSVHAKEVKQRIGDMEKCLEAKAPAPAPAAAPVPTPAPPVVAVAAPTPAPATAPAPQEPSRIPPRPMAVAGLVSGGVGVVLIGTSVFFGLRARDAADRVNDRFAEGGPWTQEYRDLEAQGQGDETLSIVLAATGVAALAAGTILYVWGSREDVALAVMPGGAAVTWAGWF